jgi:ribose-phosphate pyrophosphokinase
MNNYIFDIEGRQDNLLQEIIKEAGISRTHDMLPPVEEGKVTVTRFPSDEYSVSYMHSVRGHRVFLLCTTLGCSNLLKLQSAVDAAKRNMAAEVIAIVPYFAYARQDRKDARKGFQRSSIGASMVAITLEALGLDRIIIADMHSEQLQGMFRIPVDHAECSELLAKAILSLYADGGKVTLMSPDAGGVKRMTKVLDYIHQYKKDNLHVKLGFCSKERDEHNKVLPMTLAGDVEGRDTVFIDDMFDTAGTIEEAARTVRVNGAVRVFVVGTHGIFSDPAPERLRDAHLDGIIVTNSIDQTSCKVADVNVISMAPVLAQYVRASINLDAVVRPLKTTTI